MSRRGSADPTGSFLSRCSSMISSRAHLRGQGDAGSKAMLGSFRPSLLGTTQNRIPVITRDLFRKGDRNGDF